MGYGCDLGAAGAEISRKALDISGAGAPTCLWHLHFSLAPLSRKPGREMWSLVPGSLAIAALVVLSSAQGVLENLPSCGHDCVQRALDTYNCDPTRCSCLCPIQVDLSPYLTSCRQTACDITPEGMGPYRTAATTANHHLLPLLPPFLQRY
ncbi:hypothetical protein GGR56DRAFT_648503 [Xylariaceae sp. FL0804]|nr:hypothetical protein GGR56DRAFT_648503 [Xylariaceae sp. FL0804]